MQGINARRHNIAAVAKKSLNSWVPMLVIEDSNSDNTRLDSWALKLDEITGRVTPESKCSNLLEPHEAIAANPIVIPRNLDVVINPDAAPDIEGNVELIAANIIGDINIPKDPPDINR